MTTALYYLADEVTAQKVANSLGIEKSTISKIIRRLCFYFRKLFPCICLTQQHHYFANRTSYKTSLLIANYFFLLYNLHKIYISNKTNQKTFTKNKKTQDLLKTNAYNECCTRFGLSSNTIFGYVSTVGTNRLRNSHSEVFLEKRVLKRCSKFTGKHPCRSEISIKLLCNFIKITLRHVCSPVNLLHIFSQPFLKNTSGWLLISFETNH